MNYATYSIVSIEFVNLTNACGIEYIMFKLLVMQ
jgi:hypothetical protein